MVLRDCFPAVGFGTSGLRALVRDLTPAVVVAYSRAFARTLAVGAPGCLIGWDLRPSSPAIAAAVAAGLAAEGVQPLVVGAVPTPALAFAGITRGLPSVMVTGSHIPFDRNGVKFYRASGEISKADEVALGLSPLPTGEVAAVWMGARDESVLAGYAERYRRLLPSAGLRGWRIGVYQHSGVARDLLVSLLREFGAQVVALGRSDTFVPIDTEAVSLADEARAARWCAAYGLQAVVSTDGDGDRPWIADEGGCFIPGDVVGPLVARWLGVMELVAPLNVNSVAERSGWFTRVVRTRIGSPFVLEAMAALEGPVAGYEGNGGFLLGSPLRGLRPLLTRDALLPIVGLLSAALEQGVALSALRGSLPARYTAAGRLQGVVRARLLGLLAAPPAAWLEGVVALDERDGLRMTRADGEVVHLRASGNAPEVRVYVETVSVELARVVRDRWLARLRDELMSRVL